MHILIIRHRTNLFLKSSINNFLEKPMNSISKAIIAIVMGAALAQTAAADEAQYCQPAYTSGGDSAYVPCISMVDLGNGHLVGYDEQGNVVVEEWK